MDALQLFGLRYNAIHREFVDDILDDLSEAQVRARPHGLNSIAWLLWHTARIEDVGVNRLAADRPQILAAGDWTARLGIARADVGVAMTADEVEALSRRIDLAALRGYWDAVASATAAVAGTLTAADLDTPVAPGRVRSVIAAEGVVVPGGEWVADFWAAGHRRGWFLLQTALLHPYGHLFDCLTTKGLVTA